MTTPHLSRPTFWETVKLLLATARTRANGRRERAQQMLNNRSDGKGTDWGGVGFFFFTIFMFVINGFAGAMLIMAVDAAQRSQVERQGKIVVSTSFYNYVAFPETNPDAEEETRPAAPNDFLFTNEAKEIVERYGGSKTEIERRLRDSVRNHGISDLVPSKIASPGLKALGKTGRFPEMLGSLVLILWLTMLVFQGEGAEVDVQRRRYPMWEWIFSHPVPPGAVFLAEMLSPIAANPIYWAAPLFTAILYGTVYDVGAGILAFFIIGAPISIAAACLGKALEIGILLRFSPRTRGAVIGLMGWLGYTSMLVPVVGTYFVPIAVTRAAGILRIFTALPSPPLGLFLGMKPDGSFSFALGALIDVTVSAATIALAIWVSVWGTKKGLSSSFAMEKPSRASIKNARFGKEPLYHKEFLWFTRDRSAIVQTILVPLSVAGFQLFNMRALLVHAQGEWNYLCGVAIFFGTYFLWILGPKSLQSEGAALWISLTWPRGLESLLKAKAWLWAMISSCLVAVVLIYAATLFHSDTWKITLVGVGWYLFSRSMAEKSVTLVTVTSSSGEPEKIPSSRRWAAQLGMLTFAIGIVTQQWQLAIIGIVYSYLTAAAMWQNLRARLPYLYDPWSEKMPPPPTLMHGMVAISALVELSALISTPFILIGGRQNSGMGLAIGYGLAAIIVSLVVSNFLRQRDVRPQDIWCWVKPGTIEECEPLLRRFGVGDFFGIRSVLGGACGGIALGLFAIGYITLIRHIPSIAEIIRKSDEQMTKIPDLHIWYAIMAIGFAPFAEEYLFRGLLFRALDREWGGWKAILGSAAFFAIYHPPLAWLPVFLLATANCFLFKKTGRLAPAVALHMLYNAVVTLA
jgi:membrane protease YdiL (CAAX protease family)